MIGQKMLSWTVSRLFSAECRASALEENIERFSRKASARFARGSVASQDGRTLSATEMDARRARIRKKLAKSG
jgi:hypothetical protein